MNRYITSHPDAECLLQYADGELPNRAAAQVRAHLEACWRCRTEIEEVQATITEYVRFQETVFETPPEPPVSWDRFEIRLDRLIAERQARPRRRWMAAVFAVAALAAACFVAVRLNHPPAVDAAELLRKASGKEVASATRPHRLRIHDSAGRDEAALHALFVEANYSWENPLSATAFRGWRNGLQERHDEVLLESGVYRIRTDTATGTLEEAVLNLRADDLGVVSGSFRFRSQELVEMRVLPDEPLPPVTQAPPETLRPPAAAAPTAAAGPAEELHVLAALHRAGADLGEQIEVTRDSAGHIVVTATGIAPGRRAAIGDALAALPGVIPHFAEPSLDLSKPAQAESAPGRAGSPDAGGPLQPQLRAALGGAVELSNFTDQALETSGAAMVQAHDLRDLAARFPADVEARLATDDRSVLEQIRRDHIDSLTLHFAEMQHLLNPVLTALGALEVTAAGSPPPPAANWQTASEPLFAAAQRLDRTIATLLTGGGDHPAAAAPDTARALQQLQAVLDWYRRF